MRLFLQAGDARLLALGGDGLDGRRHLVNALLIGVACTVKLARALHRDERLGNGHVVIEVIGGNVHELLDGAGADGGRPHGRRADVERRMHLAHNGELGALERVLHRGDAGVDGYHITDVRRGAHHAIVEDEALPRRFRPPPLHQLEAVEVAAVIGSHRGGIGLIAGRSSLG